MSALRQPHVDLLAGHAANPTFNRHRLLPMEHSLLKHLTAPQREAVTHVNGPLLILAGPGSGKTRVITHRVAYLLSRGVPAGSILALTFTNKAAEEMRSRVAQLAPNRPVWISTFHRFCARTLRAHAALVGLGENFTIYDTSDAHAALKRAIELLDIDPTHYSPQNCAAAISWAKNNLVLPEEYAGRPGSPLGNVIARLYPLYQQELQRCNAVDFDDLLMYVARLLKENAELRSTLDAQYRFVMVDEYQDTNLAQYLIVRGLSIDAPNLAVTGDPDQSIYGWRGANLKNILDFEHDYPEVAIVRLEQNYRSTKSILRVADQLIGHNRQRKDKALFTDNEEGAPVRFTTFPTQQDEAESIATRIATLCSNERYRPSDIAIFYRVNALSRALEYALLDQGIPYQIVRGVEFYQRKEVKDVLAYLTLLNNPRDDNAFLRVINTPPRGIGKSTLERLAEYASRQRQPLLEAAREIGLIESIAKKAAVAVARFVAFYDKLGAYVLAPVEEILGHVLEESGYRAHLQASKDEDDQERLANIEELLTAAREFDERNPGDGQLEAFLEQASLVNDTDAWDGVQERVTLMTLHASKGLEFPVVFIVAVEEGLVPHERSRDNPQELEEERRLLFVGITRAEKELHLSRAMYRNFRGQMRMTIPSMFLMEMPMEEMDVDDGVVGIAAQPFDDDLAFDPAHDDFGDTAEPDEVTADQPSTRSSTPPAPVPMAMASSPRVTTAAALAGAGQTEMAPPISPRDFTLGMLVTHPEYGLGKIVALSGGTSSRKATVAFAAGAGERTFVLHLCPLRPVR